MNKQNYFLLITFIFIGCQRSPIKDRQGNNLDSAVKIEMNLSAFGVESDDFPSIDGKIDFVNKTSRFKKSYYNPAMKTTTYDLSKKEIKTIFDIIQKSDLTKLKKEYSVGKDIPDQPRSTMTIYTKENEYEIDDYGLEGDSLLIKIYDIAYKINNNR